MKILTFILIITIALAAIFGILAVILEFRHQKQLYEILMKTCYILIGICGAILAWLAYFKIVSP